MSIPSSNSVNSIMYILHRFGPDFLGGADIYTYEIAKEILRNRHKVNVFCIGNINDKSVPLGKIQVADYSYDGISVRKAIFNWRTMSEPFNSLYVINYAIENALISFIEEIKPQVVHVTADVLISAAAITAPQKLGIPVVLTLTGKWYICPATSLLNREGSTCDGCKDGITCHECMFGVTRLTRLLKILPTRLQCNLVNILGKFPILKNLSEGLSFIKAVENRKEVIRDLLNKVNYIISPSQCHKEVYRKSGILPDEKINFSKHGHNIDAAKKGTDKSPSSKIRFGFIGNVVYEKGVDLIIDAFNLLGPNPEITASIYGNLDVSPGFVDQLQKSVNPGIDCQFFGYFPHKDISFILSNIDVLIVPSRCVENAPLTIAEAQASQTPIIGSNSCGIAEWIDHDINGLLFTRNNPKDLAYQIQRILSEPGLINRLKLSIPAVKSVQEEIAELLNIYTNLSR